MVSRLPFLYASPEALEQRFFDHAVEGRVVVRRRLEAQEHADRHRHVAQAGRGDPRQLPGAGTREVLLPLYVINEPRN